MPLIQALIYPTLVLILAIFLVITVPRQTLRILLPYGVVLGALVNFFYDLLFGHLFKITWFEHLGILNASGHPILGYLAWTLVMVFYLYFWPKDNLNLGYLYLFAWSLLATGFSQVVKQAELYSYVSWFYPLPMFFTFLGQFAFATWVVKPWSAEW